MTNGFQRQNFGDWCGRAEGETGPPALGTFRGLEGVTWRLALPRCGEQTHAPRVILPTAGTWDAV